MNRKLFTGLWGLALVLSVAVALASYRYLVPGVDMVPTIKANAHGGWIFLHAGAASTALLVGGFQFLGGLRRRSPRVHRLTGRIYAVACILGGVSGLPLALGTSAGPIGTLGFGTLAVVWIVATGMGWERATSRRFAEHREWMIRSFALTFAAVTLRIWLPLSMLAQLDFMPAYQAIAFLCWVPNLILAEAWIRLGRSPLGPVRGLATAAGARP